MATHSSITSRSTGRERSRRLRTALVVVSSSSELRFNIRTRNTGRFDGFRPFLRLRLVHTHKTGVQITTLALTLLSLTV